MTFPASSSVETLDPSALLSREAPSIALCPTTTTVSPKPRTSYPIIEDRPSHQPGATSSYTTAFICADSQQGLHPALRATLAQIILLSLLLTSEKTRRPFSAVPLT